MAVNGASRRSRREFLPMDNPHHHSATLVRRRAVKRAAGGKCQQASQVAGDEGQKIFTVTLRAAPTPKAASAPPTWWPAKIHETTTGASRWPNTSLASAKVGGPVAAMADRAAALRAEVIRAGAAPVLAWPMGSEKRCRAGRRALHPSASSPRCYGNVRH